MTALEIAPNAPERDPSEQKNRIAAYGVTWLSYATYYMGRKGFSVAKASILEKVGKDALTFFHPSKYIAVGVETVYLATYAIGQYLSGTLGDRIGARRLVGYGMLISAAACVAFGAASTSVIFLIAWAINGLAQSTGWPGNVKAMAEWTTRENRGAVMGIWATCYQVGGIAATSFAAWLIVRTGWRGTFFGPAALIGIVGVLVLVLLKRGPGLVDKNKASESQRKGIDLEARAAQRAVLRNPTLWSYGASYFFIKLIRYSLLFWLPYYLKTVLKYSDDDAGYLSNAFEIGGVVGTIALGRISDKNRQLSRPQWSAISLVGLAVALFAYARVGGLGWGPNFAAMFLVGALLFGPDALLSGAAAQDAGGPHAAAIAAGLINAIGSTGAILQELVTRGISENFGWDALFYSFLVLALLAAAALIPTFKRDTTTAPEAPR